MTSRPAPLVVTAITAWAIAVTPTSASFMASTSNVGNTIEASPDFCAGTTQRTLTANADSKVMQARPSNNFGSLSSLDVISKDGKNARAFLNFQLPTPPAYCDLLSASLRVFTIDADVGRTLALYRVAAAWSETGITWANQPGASGAASLADAAWNWVTFDATTQVSAMYAGTNHGLQIRDNSEGYAAAEKAQEISSREGSNPPELSLTFG